MRSLISAIALLTATSGLALAADLPVYKSEPVFQQTAPLYNWTGFYLGAQAGYAFSDSSYSVSTQPVVNGNPIGGISFDNNGFLIGVHAGYNYQVNNFVFGLEGDIEFADLEDGGSAASNLGTVNYQTDYNYLASITGRVGVAFDQALIYVKGGVAFADIDYSLNIPAVNGTWSTSDTRTGYVIGAGLQYAYDNNWSTRIEYTYTDFGDETVSAPVVGTAVQGISNVEDEVHAIKAGISYRF